MLTTSYEDIQEDIVSCTNEIFSTMIPMEIKSDGSFYQKEDMISTDVISLVSYTGEHSGIVAIFCSRSIALKITSSMLGIEVSEMDQDTKDAMGEVTNMIAGTLKNKIFEKFGEEYFRELETKQLKKMYGMKNHVISTGGGIILQKQNIELIKDLGIVIFLDISINSQINRVKNRKNRPLINDNNLKDNLLSLKKTRDPVYKKISNYIIDVSEKERGQIVTEIQEII